jgi:hypothetical protein
MVADPRRVAKLHRRLKLVWLALCVPAVGAVFVLDFETYTKIMLLVTVVLSFYACYIGDAATEQAAESRTPEEE